MRENLSHKGMIVMPGSLLVGQAGIGQLKSKL